MNIAELEQKADAGSVVAQSILGLCYLEGHETNVNYAEAFRWLSAASNNGASRATAGLARMYAHGLGITRDLPKAIDLYKRAAEAGEFLAQVELGRLYSRGEEVPLDDKAALKWYSMAAAQQSSVENCAELREAIAFMKRGG